MEIILAIVMFAAGTSVHDEPHWSFRDGCSVKTVTAANTNYGYASYDHCKSLPRVYNGIEWKPTSSSPTLPSA